VKSSTSTKRKHRVTVQLTVTSIQQIFLGSGRNGLTAARSLQ